VFLTSLYENRHRSDSGYLAVIRIRQSHLLASRDKMTLCAIPLNVNTSSVIDIGGHDYTGEFYKELSPTAIRFNNGYMSEETYVAALRGDFDVAISPKDQEITIL